MAWTAGSLAKAAESRRLRAAERRQAAIDSEQHVERVLDTVKPAMSTTAMPAPPPPESWWKVAPLPEAITALAAMKRAYDAAAAIVLARSATSTPTHTCWTQLHKDSVPKSVQLLCKRTIPDGRWASRDDAVFKTVDGIRIPDPVFCCNATCHEYYLRSKQPSALSRH